MSQDDGLPGAAGGHDGDDDVHTLIGAYALDAVDDVERARVERHLAGCPACAEELRSFTETAGLLGSAVATAPPAGMRAAVLAEVSRTRQLPPVAAGPAPGGRVAGGGAGIRSASRATRWLAAAASVLLLACVGLGSLAWTYRQQVDQARATAAGMSQVLADPDAMMEADFTTAGHGTMVVSGQRFMLVASDLPDLPGGQVYKLWFIDEEGPRPSVPLRRQDDGRYLAETDGFRPGDQVAITVEADPDTQVPQGDVVMQASA